MKIEATVLSDYIKKVSLNKIIPTLNLNFGETCVKTTITDPSNIVLIIGELKKEAFIEYENIGEIFIKDSRFLFDALKTFTGEITLTKIEDHLLEVKSSIRKVYITLAEEIVCENIHRESEPVLGLNETLNMSRTELGQIVKDMKLLNNDVVHISNKDGKMVFQVGIKNEYDFTQNLITCNSEEEIKVAIGNSLVHYVETLTNDPIMFIGKDKPVKFVETGENFATVVIIAPTKFEGD